MKEKRQINRLKDVMWDYYLTNKQITKEYEETYKNQKPGKFSRREKSYVVVIVIGLFLIALKYLVF